MVDVCAATCRVTHALQGGNNISDRGACLLADALKSSSCVTELVLVSWGRGREGLKWGCRLQGVDTKAISLGSERFSISPACLEWPRL